MLIHTGGGGGVELGCAERIAIGQGVPSAGCEEPLQSQGGKRGGVDMLCRYEEEISPLLNGVRDHLLLHSTLNLVGAMIIASQLLSQDHHLPRRVDVLTVEETRELLKSDADGGVLTRLQRRFGPDDSPSFVLAPVLKDSHYTLLQIELPACGSTGGSEVRVTVLDSLSTTWSESKKTEALHVATTIVTRLLPKVPATDVHCYFHHMSEENKQTDGTACGYYVAAAMMYLGMMNRPAADLHDLSQLQFSMADVPAFKTFLAVFLSNFYTFFKDAPNRSGGWEEIISEAVQHGDFSPFPLHPYFFERCQLSPIFQPVLCSPSFNRVFRLRKGVCVLCGRSPYMFVYVTPFPASQFIGLE